MGKYNIERYDGEQWTADQLGTNDPVDTIEEAQAGIEVLRKLPDFKDARLRVGGVAGTPEAMELVKTAYLKLRADIDEATK